MLANVVVNFKTAKIATDVALLASTYLQRVQIVGIILMIGWWRSSQACTLRRLLSWKAIISLLSQESMGKDTQ